MKTIIVNIGPEYITGAACEHANRKLTLERVFEFDAADFYNNGGTLDLKPVAKRVKEAIPKNLRGCDVQIILPSYAADVEYIDTHTVAQKRRTKPLPSNMTETVVRVGENQTRQIDENIQFNTKLLTAILKEFYGCGVNVRTAYCAETCYHNYIAAYNRTDSFENSEPAVYVNTVWGPHEIKYIFSINNLPVDIKTSDFSLMNVYRDIRAQGSDISFGMAVKILNLMYASALSGRSGLVLDFREDTVQRGKENVRVSGEDLNNVSRAFFDFVRDMCEEINRMYDHARQTYSLEQVRFCLNSRLMDECVSYLIGEEFPIAYIDDPDPLTVYDTVFEFIGVPTLDDRFNPIIGAAIEGLKKGADFYDS